MEWLERTFPGLVRFLSSPAVWISLSLLSLVTCIASVVGTSWVVRRLPVDYLLSEPEHTRPAGSSGLALVLRNTLCAVLLVLGALMLVLPGQGLLTILAALSLMDFRGKRRLERRLMLRPKVLSLINRFRLRAGEPRLLAPGPSSSEDPS